MKTISECRSAAPATGRSGAPFSREDGRAAYFVPRRHIHRTVTAWEWCSIRENLEQRAEELALYLIENRTTVRAAAKKFGISKSTVHKDISERLPLYNRALWIQVKALLEENKAQRHIRGGLATRRKYRGT